MAKLKTTATSVPVQQFIDKIPSEGVRDDCYQLVKMIERVTGEPAKMWGPSIIGCGQYHYKYASGHEGDMPVAAFSPRKANLTVYYFPENEVPVKKLGKCKTSKGCIYFKKLADIDMKVLEVVVRDSMTAVRKKYPA